MRILSKRQLKEMVLYSPQHIARLEKAGQFPKRVHLGPMIDADELECFCTQFRGVMYDRRKKAAVTVCDARTDALEKVAGKK